LKLGVDVKGDIKRDVKWNVDVEGENRAGALLKGD
jgi:hypothetical protein